MSRNPRAPRPSRCTANAAAGRPHGDEAFVTGILTSAEDFERARAWHLTDARDFDGYLLDTAVLLAEARRTYGTVQARMFHVDDFADFCLLHRLDPAEPAARDRYLVNPPLQTQLLPYQGEELVGDFVPRLVRARDNGLTLRHVELLLDGGADGCGADGAPEEAGVQVRQAHQRGAELFRRMLVGAGFGAYRFLCAVEAPGGRLEAEARILHWEDGVVRINDEDLDLVCAVLCAGLYRELPGAALLHGSQGAAGACGEYRQVAWACPPGARGAPRAGERPGGGRAAPPPPPAVTFLHRGEGSARVFLADGAARVRVQHAPADELLGEDRRRLVVDHGEGAEVVLADREHLAVVVAALALDGGRVALQRAGLLRRDLGQSLQVEDQARRRLGRTARGAAGQQLLHRYAVELRQLGEALDGHGAVAALVGADDDSLPATLGLLLDAVQGETLLSADGPELGPELLRVVAGH